MEPWDGSNRRKFPEDESDLDMTATWHQPVLAIFNGQQAMRADLSAHMQKEDENAKDISDVKFALSRVNDVLSEFFDPEHGRFAVVERNLSLLANKRSEDRGFFSGAKMVVAGFFAIVIAWEPLANLIQRLMPPK